MPLAAVPACILVRHAHAEWPDYRGRDFDRPLTQRGLEQAHAAAQAIRSAGLLPRFVIASPALRTDQTSRILLQRLELLPDALRFMESLYNADARTLEAALQACARQDAPVMLVAHNPGISDLARRLTGTASPPFRPAEWRAIGVGD